MGRALHVPELQTNEVLFSTQKIGQGRCCSGHRLGVSPFRPPAAAQCPHFFDISDVSADSRATTLVDRQGARKKILV